MEAIKEALINALAHRDYTFQGSEIHIDMYDDRLEIINPGGLLDGKMIQNMDINNIASMRRNPIICDILTRMNYMERRGSGLKKIVDAYDANNVPLFKINQQSFFITILNNLNYKKPINKKNILSDQSNVGTNIGTNIGTNVGTNNAELKNKIIYLINLNPKITYNEISKTLNIPRRTLSRIMKDLQNNNFLERIGRTRGF